MGLNFPSDLAAWESWHRRQNRLRSLRATVTRASASPAPLHAATRGAEPAVLLAIDSASRSGIASLHALINHLPSIAVVSSVHSSEQLLDLLGGIDGGARSIDAVELPPSIAATVSAGHYLPAGELAWRHSMTRGSRNIIVQHGLLTPFAPPLPSGALVLAFSDADGKFWASGRPDVEWMPVGAQLLWDAKGDRPAQATAGSPVYLGQLHGSELPRRGKSRSTTRFWKKTGAVYRPHPFEVDKLSRLQHQLWERRGMRIDRGDTALRDLGGPVVGAFSTGILEAAAAGIPSWAYYENAPTWLREFWERYEVHRWGIDAEPTPPPQQPAAEPAQAIADAVREVTKEHK